VEKDKIVNHIYRRRESGRGFSIVVIAEGAKLPWLSNTEGGVDTL